MAESDVAFYRDEAGQVYARLPGTGQAIPVSRQDIETIQEGGVEAFVRSAANSLGQAVTGAMTLGGVAGASEALGELREGQALRAGGSPVASVLGAAAPDVAIGVATGGTGTLARRVGTTAAVEGGLVAARTPENPLGGFALGAGLGAAGGALGPAAGGLARSVPAAPVGGGRMVGRVLGTAQRTESAEMALGGRVTGMAREAASSAAARARNAVANRQTTVGQALEGVEADPFRQGRAGSTAGAAQISDEAPVTMASSFGNVSDDIPLSSAEAQWARALTSDEDAVAAGIMARETAQKAKSNPLDPGGYAQRQVEDARSNWGTRRVLDELGLADEGYTRLTDDALAAGFRAEQDVFRRVIDESVERGQPIKTRWDDPDGQSYTMGQRAELIGQDLGEAFMTQTIRKSIDQLNELSEYNVAQPAKFASTWDALVRARDRAWKQGRQSAAANPAAGEAINDLLQIMQDALGKSIDPDDAARLGVARKRWGILSDLTRGRVIDDNTGTINFRTLRNNRARRDSLFRSGRRSDNRFDADVKLLAALDQELVPNSGTADRLMAGQITRTALGAAAGAAGMGIVF